MEERIWRLESKMGGSIAVTVREENGKEHRMCRWTNTLPWFVKNIRLLNKDKKHLRKYLDTWESMVDDWNKNQTTINFDLNMTPVYAPYPFLAPHDYGLVVVDMLSDHILDYQGYFHSEIIGSVGVSSDMSSVAPGVHKIVIGGPQPNRLGRQAFYQDEEVSEATRFRELLEAGKIKGLVKDYRKGVVEPLKENTLDEAVKIIEDDRERFSYFQIDMSPFQLIRYHEPDPEEAEKIRTKIKDLGFTLTTEEDKLWDEWINEHREDR